MDELSAIKNRGSRGCKHVKQDDGHARNSRLSTFIKTYLDFGFKMAQVNFAGSERDGFGPPVRPRSKVPAWSRAVEIYFYYFFSKMIYSGILKHNYERANDEYKETLNDNNENSNMSSWLLARQEKEAELLRAIELADTIGFPFYETGPTFDIMLILIMTYALLFYPVIRIYDHLCGPIALGVARRFLDPNLERALMIKNELGPLIDNYKQSAANCLSVHRYNLECSRLSQLASLKNSTRLQHDADMMIRRKRSLQQQRQQFIELRLSQARNVEMLRAMVASGELDPLNRQAARWNRLIAPIYCTLALHWTTTGWQIVVFTLIWLPCSGWLNDFKLHYGWRGIYYTLETLVFFTILVHIVVFPFALIVANTLDQIVYARELKRIVAELSVDIAIRTNGTESNARDESASKIANRQLMRVLIQYRLFKQQLSGVQPLIGFTSFNMIGTLLLVPAAPRIYAPHLSAFMRQLSMYYCLSLIATLDMVLMPTCYLHARCLELYRALSCLLARLDYAVSQHLHDSDGNQLHKNRTTMRLDKHTLTLLRRELHMPEFATQQFATDAYIMGLTYSNLMAVNFYCGLWLVPMMMSNTSGLTSGTSALLDML